MARLIYSAITSLDGYTADTDGNFDWAAPDEEVHAFVNDIERPVGTYLYGRRMYETMLAWETMPGVLPDVVQDYAEIWRAADKVVYSTTLAVAASARTRVVGSFAPEAIRALKEQSVRDLSVGGAHLAALALKAGLVDELHLYIAPIVVGGGTRCLPEDVRTELELLEQRRFGNGMLHLHYRTRNRSSQWSLSGW